MSVQSLINRRAQTQRALSNTRQLKATAQTKIDRLKQAKAEISQLIVETTQMERKLTSFSISPVDWQGSTERDFRTGPKKSMEKAVSNYVTHLQDSSSRIDQEIQRYMSQIETYNSQISSYSRTISLLNIEIRNLRNG